MIIVSNRIHILRHFVIYFDSKLRAQLGLKPLFLEDQANTTVAMTTTNVHKMGTETSPNPRVSGLCFQKGGLIFINSWSNLLKCCGRNTSSLKMHNCDSQ